MDPSQIVGALFAGVLQTFGVRSGTEQPAYQVVERTGPLEVRQYAGRVAAEVTVAGDEEQARNDGFRLVAGYIFGGNTASSQIAMTAPVAQAAKGQPIAMTAPVAQAETAQGWRIQFFMPAKYTLETLPKPKDGRVRLAQLPSQTFAVIVFSGSRSAKAVAAQQSRLMGAVSGSVWKASGEPQAWFYDPPWTPPFFRRNEVAVAVQRR